MAQSRRDADADRGRRCAASPATPAAASSTRTRREYLIRNLGAHQPARGPARISWSPAKDGRPILLRAGRRRSSSPPAIKRGDAGYNGAPAVIARRAEAAGGRHGEAHRRRSRRRSTELAAARCRPGMTAPSILFRQADFIEASIDNVDRARCATAPSWSRSCSSLFLLNVRTTFISLTAIPLSIADHGAGVPVAGACRSTP